RSPSRTRLPCHRHSIRRCRHRCARNGHAIAEGVIAMFENWTFGRRLAVAFTLAGLAVTVIAVVAYRSTTGLIDNDKMLTHSYAVRQNLALLLSEMKDAETGQRGYIITGEDSYLDPYRSSLSQIANTEDAVRRLTSDNPSQQARLATVTPLIDAKF